MVSVPSLEPVGTSSAPERFRQVCRVAGDYGISIALEFLGIAPEVNNLRSARGLVATAACPNGGLVIDTFHFV